jgi:hypothetical protein
MTISVAIVKGQEITVEFPKKANPLMGSIALESNDVSFQ